MVDRLCAAVAMSLGKPLHNWSLHHSSMGVCFDTFTFGFAQGAVIWRPLGSGRSTRRCRCVGGSGAAGSLGVPAAPSPELFGSRFAAGGAPGAHRKLLTESLPKRGLKVSRVSFGTRERNGGGLGG